MKHGFHVRVGTEPVSALVKPLSEVVVVVDLAVEDDCDGFVLVEDRLVAACDVDDAEPPKREAGLVIDQEAVRVRPPMSDRDSHLLQDLAICCGTRQAGDPAHLLRSTFDPVRRPRRRGIQPAQHITGVNNDRRELEDKGPVD